MSINPRGLYVSSVKVHVDRRRGRKRNIPIFRASVPDREVGRSKYTPGVSGVVGRAPRAVSPTDTSASRVAVYSSKGFTRRNVSPAEIARRRKADRVARLARRVGR